MVLSSTVARQGVCCDQTSTSAAAPSPLPSLPSIIAIFSHSTCVPFTQPSYSFCSGGKKFRALRLDTGNFAWGSEGCTRKTRIVEVRTRAVTNVLPHCRMHARNHPPSSSSHTSVGTHAITHAHARAKPCTRMWVCALSHTSKCLLLLATTTHNKRRRSSFDHLASLVLLPSISSTTTSTAGDLQRHEPGARAYQHTHQGCHRHD